MRRASFENSIIYSILFFLVSRKKGMCNAYGEKKEGGFNGAEERKVSIYQIRFEFRCFFSFGEAEPIYHLDFLFLS